MSDLEKIKKLQGKLMKDIAAGALIPMMRIGDELDLFRKLYEIGPSTYSEFSQKINLDTRYIKEWLLALSSAGYIQYNEIGELFSISEEHFSVLADDAFAFYFLFLLCQISKSQGLFLLIVLFCL